MASSGVQEREITGEEKKHANAMAKMVQKLGETKELSPAEKEVAQRCALRMHHASLLRLANIQEPCSFAYLTSLLSEELHAGASKAMWQEGQEEKEMEDGDAIRARTLRRLDQIEEFSFEEKEVVIIGFWYIDHATLLQLANIKDPCSFADALRQKYLQPGQHLNHMFAHVSNVLKYSAKLWKLRKSDRQHVNVGEPSILTRNMRAERKMPLQDGCGVDHWAWEQEEKRRTKAIRDHHEEMEIDHYLFPGEWTKRDGQFNYSPTLQELPAELPFQTRMDKKRVEKYKQIYVQRKEEWHKEGLFRLYSVSPLSVLRDIANRACDLIDEVVL